MLQFKSMHFLTGEELSQSELLALIHGADQLRQHRSQAVTNYLAGKTMALMFDKPSLRTRVSFTVGIQELGGSVMELLGSQKKTEEPEDSIRVLQGMIHGLMIRTLLPSTLAPTDAGNVLRQEEMPEENAEDEGEDQHEPPVAGGRVEQQNRDRGRVTPAEEREQIVDDPGESTAHDDESGDCDGAHAISSSCLRW